MVVEERDDVIKMVLVTDELRVYFNRMEQTTLINIFGKEGGNINSFVLTREEALEFITSLAKIIDLNVEEPNEKV